MVYEEKVILGRVTIPKSYRGNGSGRVLVEKALHYIQDNHPHKNIEIVAMSYLRDFYTSFGLKSTTDQYIIDGHGHEDMILVK